MHQRPEFTINLSLVRGSLTTFAILAVPAQQLIYFCPEEGLPIKYDIQNQAWFDYEAATDHQDVFVGLSQSSQQNQNMSNICKVWLNLARTPSSRQEVPINSA